MARFDVHPFGLYGADYLLNVQADIFDMLETRICIPLVAIKSAKNQQYAKLKPVLKIAGKNFVMITTDMAAIDIQILKKPIANLEEQRHTIVDSIDFLLQGF